KISNRGISPPGRSSSPRLAGASREWTAARSVLARATCWPPTGPFTRRCSMSSARGAGDIDEGQIRRKSAWFHPGLPPGPLAFVLLSRDSRSVTMLRRLLLTVVTSALVLGVLAAPPASAQDATINLFVGAFVPRPLVDRGVDDVLYRDFYLNPGGFLVFDK